MRFGTLSLVLGTLLLSSPRVDAAVPAVRVDPAAVPGNLYDFAIEDGVIGSSFWLSQPVTVVGIGWYDHGADGLLNLHQVGIWHGVPLDDMTFLRGDVVPAGTDAPLDGLYRVITFQEPLTLEAGRYSVAGTYSGPGDDETSFMLGENPNSFPADPRVRIGTPVTSNGKGFSTPDGSIATYGLLLGPMLYIEVVPEPSSAVLVLAACGVLASSRLRRALHLGKG